MIIAKKKILGIDVGLDATALILVALIGNSVLTYFQSKVDASIFEHVLATTFTTVLFMLSILAHEFGHALVGRKYGIGFESIILHALGGAATMSRNVHKASAEFWMALAGPLVSFGLFFLFALFSFISLFTIGNGLLSISFGVLASINLILGLFNLLPAFPLDGGRVLRSAIWWKTDKFVYATKLASIVSKGFSIAGAISAVFMMFGVYIPYLGVGFISGLWIMAISAFLFVLSGNEYKAAKNIGGL
ncbi:MAG: M50 family metallopeptidase [Candidatus Njordarchaeales archaeon]